MNGHALLRPATAQRGPQRNTLTTALTQTEPSRPAGMAVVDAAALCAEGERAHRRNGHGGLPLADTMGHLRSGQWRRRQRRPPRVLVDASSSRVHVNAVVTAFVLAARRAPVSAGTSVEPIPRRCVACALLARIRGVSETSPRHLHRCYRGTQRCRSVRRHPVAPSRSSETVRFLHQR